MGADNDMFIMMLLLADLEIAETKQRELQKDLHSTNMLCFSSKLKTETAYRRIPMPFLPQEKFSKRR